MPRGHQLIKVTLEETGSEHLVRWLVTAPPHYVEALQAGMRRVTPIATSYIKGFAPVRTGRLMGDIRGDVRDTPFGAVGKVQANVRESRYTEFGTKEHGGPKRYFLRGTAATKPEGIAIFDYEIRKLSESFGD